MIERSSGVFFNQISIKKHELNPNLIEYILTGGYNTQNYLDI